MYFRGLRGLGDLPPDPCTVNPADPVCQAFWGPTGQPPPGSDASRPLTQGPGTGIDIEMPPMYRSDVLAPMTPAGLAAGFATKLVPIILVGAAAIWVGIKAKKHFAEKKS